MTQTVKPDDQTAAPTAEATDSPVAEATAPAEGTPLTLEAAEPLPPTIKDKFMERVHSYLPAPAVPQYMKDQRVDFDAGLRLTNRIAVVSDEAFSAMIARYADVTTLSEEDDPSELPWADLDMILIAGQIAHHGAPWRRALLNLADGATPLMRLIKAAKAAHTPVALWLQEEDNALPFFAHFIDEVDLIIAPPGCDTGRKRTLHMQPCVDAKIYNPMVEHQPTANKLYPLFPFLVDGYHEIGMKYEGDSFVDYLSPMLDYNWWATDSSTDLRNNDQKHATAMQRRFMGSLRGDRVAFPLRLANAYVLPKPVVEGRPRYSARRHLQACASKTLTVTDSTALKMPFLSNLPDSKKLATYIDWLMTDTVGRNASQHLAWRHAMTHHTCFEGLEAILGELGIEANLNAPANPSINVVVPTIRPELIPFVLSGFEAQAHPNKTLTIVVNGVDVPRDIRAMMDARPNANLLSMPNDKSIGYCMNFGMDYVESDYWAKFDDDDLYGAHYLSDMMLQRKYVDFDMTGKVAIFTYLEERDALHIRRMNSKDTFNHSIGGGTLLVKQGAGAFPEDVRGYADTLFLVDAATRGKQIVAADPFNFVQIRRADPTSHTWTAAAHELDLKGPHREGIDLAGVML
ncbi:glycosyltransferase [Alphaproteobacteria bacterium KMM 3653]|uniref:Glycosyltransferase n=1 Tax=Harenicola maris TaxID=2841044 RepID=A0AAP2G3Z6_9RHOB|nr:glycosyltransferase [Harenicola maris]